MFPYSKSPQTHPYMSQTQFLTQQFQQQAENCMDCIIKPVGNVGGLYVGAIEAAQNLRYLHRNGITHVLTLSYEEPVNYSSSDRIEHKMIKCHDQVGFSIVEIFSQVKDFINSSLQQGNLLIHCMAGISRSASVCILYLMTTRMINLAQALEIVKRARPIVRPNPGFLRQLLIFEKALFGTITSQLTYKITPYFGVQSDPSLAPGSVLQEQQIPQSPQISKQSSQQPYIQPPVIPASRSQRPLMTQGYGSSQGIPPTMSSSMINTIPRQTYATPQRQSSQLKSADFTKPLVKISAKALDTTSISTKDSSPLMLKRDQSPLVNKQQEPFFTPQLQRVSSKLDPSSQILTRSPSTNQSYCFPNNTYNFQKSFYMMEQLQNRSISPFQVNYRSGFSGAFQR